MTESRDRNLAAQNRLGELLAARDPQGLREVLADDLIDRDPAPGQAAGATGIVDFWTEMFSAFSDLTVEPQTVVADDDQVAAVFDLSGKHDGVFQGYEPTGRTFTVRGIQVGRFEDGRLVERWGATDQAGMLSQLGLAG